MTKYNKWERDIMDVIIDKLEVPNGDAQGIIEANNFILAQEWSKVGLLKK